MTENGTQSENGRLIYQQKSCASLRRCFIGVSNFVDKISSRAALILYVRYNGRNPIVKWVGEGLHEGAKCQQPIMLCCPITANGKRL